MSRGLLGAAAGAGGASIYFSGLGDSVRFVLDHGMGFRRGSGGASLESKHYDELHRMVQQLSQEMSRKQQGITIMHGNDSRSNAVYYVAVVAAGGAIYLRVFRGWKLVDMMYVTRSGLNKSVGRLSEGLEGLGQRLTSVKTYLQSQIRSVAAKQDQTIAAQAAMKEHLGVVGTDVENTRAEVSQMHGTVRELEANMEQMSLSQQYANRGIYILCKVVGDMMKGPSGSGGHRHSPVAAELDAYIRTPPTVGGRIVPGLEGLLQDSERPSSRGSGGGVGPFGRGSFEAGHMARAATESAIQSKHSGMYGLSQSHSGMDRSYSSAGGDRSAYAKGGGGGGGHFASGPDWQPPSSGSSPRSSVPDSIRSSRYEPGPGTPQERDEPRVSPYRSSRNAEAAVHKQQGWGIPLWGRQPSNASSLEGSLGDSRR